MGIEALSDANTKEALSFLARRPYDNVYVSWLIASGRLGGGEAAVWRDATRQVTGACYFGAQIVLCGEAPEAIDAFAARAKRARSTRMIVGPRAAVERFWSRAESWLPRPSLVRPSQPVYALETAMPGAPSSGAGVDLGRATLAELDEIVPNSAQMMAGELGGDPRRLTGEFRSRNARLIEDGWWWRYRVDGRLAFMCNVGSVTPQTAQLQGVWSPPSMRGKGHATLGMALVCERLLREHRTLCLYVNDFNAAAIALYERVGFRRTGEFRTILFA